MSRKALIIVDVQNDFCPGGALAVPGGNEIVEGINNISKNFDFVVVTQDWHPQGHISFASTHGVEPFTKVETYNGSQTAWPDHCVKNTHGAALVDTLDVRYAYTVFKGSDRYTDSYSAFYENDRKTSTDLTEVLRNHGITEVVICGLAFDYCVLFTAVDAAKDGFKTIVLEDLCRAIDMNNSKAEAIVDMNYAGVKIMNSYDMFPE